MVTVIHPIISKHKTRLLQTRLPPTCPCHRRSHFEIIEPTRPARSINVNLQVDAGHTPTKLIKVIQRDANHELDLTIFNSPP